jgi:hypothetical protein
MKLGILIFIITAALVVGESYGQPTEQAPPEPNQERPEVLTSGPVHEAFAEPIEIKNETGIVAPIKPPANIVETMPDQKPIGKQYVWIPGYWAWDAQRTNYIWVSGCWRAAPPDRYWVPGYWYETTGGWEWVAGFWASSPNEMQIQYLPAPPVVTDLEATGLPPNPNDIWVPSCWYWYQDSYVLRAGYWLSPHENWMWTPSCYVWTPRGYVFVSGYWDYSLDRRGVLFAPVDIPRSFYLRPGFSLSLSTVVDIDDLQLSLFAYPRYCHYYFGDYYSDTYIGFGIYPCFEWMQYRTWYDPIYFYNSWTHRATSEQWYDHERKEYEFRRDNPAFRPARTFSEMQQRSAQMPESQRKDIQTVMPIDSFVTNTQGAMKFERANSTSKGKYIEQSQNVHKFSEQRKDWESRSSVTGTTQQPSERTGTQLSENKQTTRLPSENPQSGVMQGNRETHISQPEQARIPSPPIVGNRNSSGIFGGSTITPAHPDAEQRTTNRSTGGNERNGRR